MRRNVRYVLSRSISNGFSNLNFWIGRNRVFSVGMTRPALPLSESRFRDEVPGGTPVVIKKAMASSARDLGILKTVASFYKEGNRAT